MPLDPLNPYASPEIPRTPTEPGEDFPPSAPQYKLFSRAAICVTAFFATFAASAALMAINYFRAGRPGAGLGMLAFGVLFTATCFAAASYAPVELPSLAWSIVYVIVAYSTLANIHEPLLTQHRLRGGSDASNWLAAGIALVVLVLLAAIVVDLLAVLPESWLPEEEP